MATDPPPRRGPDDDAPCAAATNTAPTPRHGPGAPPPRAPPPRPAALAALFALALGAAPAGAAGLFSSQRGVRPTGRGGAFVAGADDLGAIAYNPAGLAEAGSQLLADASVFHFSTSFARRARLQSVDPNTGEPLGTYDRRWAPVDNAAPPLPLPTLAGSYRINERWTVAAGAFAPYTSLLDYPETAAGGPAPQRYSLLSLDGSLLGLVGAYAATRPAPWVEVGAGLVALVGTLQTTTVTNNCSPDRFLCAAESPDYDAKARVRATIVSPSAALGATFLPHPAVRVGASLFLPHWVSAAGTLKSQVPTAAVFQNASVVGESVRLGMRLPWVARAGVEVRPAPATRVEATFGYEAWSMHDRIRVTSEDVVLRDVALFPPEYRITDLTIARRYRDAWTLGVGGEQGLALGALALDLRAGVFYERSAVPKGYLSVFSPDYDKVFLSAGAGVHATPRLRLDASASYALPATVDVAPDEARLTKLSALRTLAPGDEPPVNAGTYKMSILTAGLGARYLFP
jgi:long-chain fatty acid transport protein